MSAAASAVLAGSVLGRGYARTAWALLRRPVATLRAEPSLGPSLRFLLATALVLGSSHLVRFLPLFWPSAEDGPSPPHAFSALLVMWVVQLAVPLLGLAVDVGWTVSVLHRAWIAAQVGRLAAARDGVRPGRAWIPALLTFAALYAFHGVAMLVEYGLPLLLGIAP